jgi:hypothetical protein
MLGFLCSPDEMTSASPDPKGGKANTASALPERMSSSMPLRAGAHEIVHLPAIWFRLEVVNLA